MSTFEELHGARLYLDSNIFIYALEGKASPRREVTTELLRQGRQGVVEVVTSVLTRGEVLVHPLHHKLIELADQYRFLLSGTDVVSLYSMDTHTIDSAAALRADYPALKLPDALHLSTAIDAGCEAFITGDRALSTASARIAVLSIDQFQGG